jgi:hypothetical protein
MLLYCWSVFEGYMFSDIDCLLSLQPLLRMVSSCWLLGSSGEPPALTTLYHSMLRICHEEATPTWASCGKTFSLSLCACHHSVDQFQLSVHFCPQKTILEVLHPFPFSFSFLFLFGQFLSHFHLLSLYLLGFLCLLLLLF